MKLITTDSFLCVYSSKSVLFDAHNFTFVSIDCNQPCALARSPFHPPIHSMLLLLLTLDFSCTLLAAVEWVNRLPFRKVNIGPFIVLNVHILLFLHRIDFPLSGRLSINKRYEFFFIFSPFSHSPPVDVVFFYHHLNMCFYHLLNELSIVT